MLANALHWLRSRSQPVSVLARRATTVFPSETTRPMPGAPDAKIRSVVEGMAPMLDILLGGSTEVNICRAEQHGSVATPAPRPAASEDRLLTPAQVRAAKRRMSK